MLNTSICICAGGERESYDESFCSTDDRVIQMVEKGAGVAHTRDFGDVPRLSPSVNTHISPLVVYGFIPKSAYGNHGEMTLELFHRYATRAKTPLARGV